MQIARDEKAIKLLSQACWSSAGWKENLDLSPADLAYLEESGYAPCAQRLSHDKCLSWALEVLTQVPKKCVVNAFVWSLGSRQLEYRSALGSFAHLHRMPTHRFTKTPGLHSAVCATCGFPPSRQISQHDFIVLNFERHKWAGVRHDEIDYMAFDLERFAYLPAVSPSDDNWALLEAILSAAAGPTTGKTTSTLKKQIRKIIASNDAEADGICHILGYLGFLAPPDHPGYDARYVPFEQREDGRPESDQEYPLSWWRGPGYRIEGVRYWFPRLARRV
jgi:hypothetical protein